jgi:diguanylate cyclase (GGDEF)-like protein/PAS domain S-box-containing protein
LQRYHSSIVLALSYYATALVALALSQGPNDTATIWAPSGLVLAAILLRPPREYGTLSLGVVLASLASNYTSGVPLEQSVQYTGANIFEAAVGMAIVRSFKLWGLSFDEPARVARFAGAAVLIAAASTLAAALLSGTRDEAFVSSWFVTVLLGQLVFVPVLVTTFQQGSRSDGFVERTGKVEIGLILAINVMVSALTFFQVGLPLLFVPVLPILLATYYLGPVGAALGVVCNALIGSIATINGLGPCALVESAWFTPTQFFQIYLVFLLTAALPLATALAARNSSFRETARQQRYFELASVTARIGHWRLNLETQSLSWSDEVFRIHGLPIGTAPSLEKAVDAYHPEDRTAVNSWLEQCIESVGEFAFDARIITPQGEIRHVNSRGQAETDANGKVTALFGVFQDVTDRVNTAQQLAAAKERADDRAEQARILAGTDQLTGVPNRRGILARLDEELAKVAESGGLLTVAMLDIDHFKSINDRFGHATGDEVLKRVANVCVDVLRDNDGFGRMGGEEFLIVLPGASCEDARGINERLACAIREQTATTINLPTATVSIGIATYEAGMSATALCAAADGALYEAKRQGRDLVMVA